jgi:hypothetical protein
MAIPILALPMVLQITMADGVPNWDAMPSCRGTISAGYAKPFKERLNVCLDGTQKNSQATAPRFRFQAELDALNR